MFESGEIQTHIVKKVELKKRTMLSVQKLNHVGSIGKCFGWAVYRSKMAAFSRLMNHWKQAKLFREIGRRMMNNLKKHLMEMTKIAFFKWRDNSGSSHDIGLKLSLFIGKLQSVFQSKLRDTFFSWHGYATQIYQLKQYRMQLGTIRTTESLMSFNNERRSSKKQIGKGAIHNFMREMGHLIFSKKSRAFNAIKRIQPKYSEQTLQVVYNLQDLVLSKNYELAGEFFDRILAIKKSIIIQQFQFNQANDYHLRQLSRKKLNDRIAKAVRILHNRIDCKARNHLDWALTGLWQDYTMSRDRQDQSLYFQRMDKFNRRFLNVIQILGNRKYLQMQEGFSVLKEHYLNRARESRLRRQARQQGENQRRRVQLEKERQQLRLKQEQEESERRRVQLEKERQQLRLKQEQEESERRRVQLQKERQQLRLKQEQERQAKRVELQRQSKRKQEEREARRVQLQRQRQAKQLQQERLQKEREQRRQQQEKDKKRVEQQRYRIQQERENKRLEQQQEAKRQEAQRQRQSKRLQAQRENKRREQEKDREREQKKIQLERERQAKRRQQQKEIKRLQQQRQVRRTEQERFIKERERERLLEEKRKHQERRQQGRKSEFKDQRVSNSPIKLMHSQASEPYEQKPVQKQSSPIAHRDTYKHQTRKPRENPQREVKVQSFQHQQEDLIYQRRKTQNQMNFQKVRQNWMPRKERKNLQPPQQAVENKVVNKRHRSLSVDNLNQRQVLMRGYEMGLQMLPKQRKGSLGKYRLSLNMMMQQGFQRGRGHSFSANMRMGHSPQFRNNFISIQPGFSPMRNQGNFALFQGYNLDIQRRSLSPFHPKIDMAVGMNLNFKDKSPIRGFGPMPMPIHNIQPQRAQVRNLSPINGPPLAMLMGPSNPSPMGRRMVGHQTFREASPMIMREVSPLRSPLRGPGFQGPINYNKNLKLVQNCSLNYATANFRTREIEGRQPSPIGRFQGRQVARGKGTMRQGVQAMGPVGFKRRGGEGGGFVRPGMLVQSIIMQNR